MVKAVPKSEITRGDLVFCCGHGVVAWGIRTAQRLRRDWGNATERYGDQYDHVAIVDRQLTDGDWTLVQALTHGVVEDRVGQPSRLSHYERYVVVANPADRERTLQFARSQIGYKYGFLTVMSFIFTLLSPRFFNIMLPRTWICSALAAESLRYGAWLHDWPDIYQVSPAQLWCALEDVVFD